MIVDGEFYFPTRDKLNDPFEFRWRDSFPKSRKIRKEVAQKLVEKAQPELPATFQKRAARKILSDIEQHAAKGRAKTSVATKGFSLGIYCASEVCDDILMWSHYAENHSGVCVGFRTSRINTHFFFPVQYSNTVPVLDVRTYIGTDSNPIVYAGLTKAKHWSYEKEWRSVWTAGKYRFPTCVDRIVIGALACRETKHAVYNAVKKAPQKIVVEQAELSETHYNLDLKRLRVGGK